MITSRIPDIANSRITHESALLPLGTTLLSLPAATRPLSHLCLLPPSDLLLALGRRLDLQVFIEDSPFGLLRTSLTLAGARFVIDVDMEADSIEGESEPPTAAGTPAFPPLAVDGAARERISGRMRLAKLSANHVTPTGEDGKSEWIAKVLRGLVEGHLEVWNELESEGEEKGKQGDAKGLGEGERIARLLPTAERLELALADVKALDVLAEIAGKTDADLFADLEVLSAGLGGAGVLLEEGLFPSFRVVAGGPVFRLRPERRGESVPGVRLPVGGGVGEGDKGDAGVAGAVGGAGAGGGGEGGLGVGGDITMDGLGAMDGFGAMDGLDAMAVDPPASEVAANNTANGEGGEGDTGKDASSSMVSPMCKGKWLVEVVDPASGTSGRGIAVRRTWLLSNPSEEEAWSNSVRVEGLTVSSEPLLLLISVCVPTAY